MYDIVQFTCIMGYIFGKNEKNDFLIQSMGIFTIVLLEKTHSIKCSSEDTMMWLEYIFTYPNTN